MVEYTVKVTCDYCGESAEGGGFSALYLGDVLGFLRHQAGWVIPTEAGGDPVVCPMCKVRATLTVLPGGA